MKSRFIFTVLNRLEKFKQIIQFYYHVASAKLFLNDPKSKVVTIYDF